MAWLLGAGETPCLAEAGRGHIERSIRFAVDFDGDREQVENFLRDDNGFVECPFVDPHSSLSIYRR